MTLRALRVGLNATCFDDRPSGAKQRFVGLYGALAAAHPEIEFIVYEPADCRAAGWLGALPNVTARPTPVRTGGSLRRAVTGFGRWRPLLRRDRLNLFETFNLPMVEAPDCPTILTIHDARHVRGGGNPLRHRVNLAIWRRALARTAMVVTVSRTMQREILALSPGTPITAIYNGIDAAGFAPPAPAERADTAARLALPAGFLLAVGHFEPRKNYAALVAAMAVLRDGGRPTPLVIVGNDSGSRAAIAAAVAAHGLGALVTLLGGVSDEDLRRLYALARLVVFPSSYEGFGIPLLEAMAARRPIVTSDIAVFRELTEGRGVYFPPDDPAAMAGAIGRVLDDSALARRIVRYGDARIGDFAFPRLADELAAVYRALA